MTIQPRLQTEDLVTLLGGTKGHRLSKSLNRRVKSLKSRVRGLLNPRLYYRTAKLTTHSKGTVLLNNEIVFKSRKLSKTLKDSKESVCFVGTIGTGVEREINRLMRRNSLADAYIVDVLGSVAVENMVEQFQNHMDSKYRKRDKSVTLRFSPGYCDWPITEQKKLFRVFDRREIEVDLLDSCLMCPRKSISGIFGVASNTEPPYNPCAHCNKLDCEARRHPYQPPRTLG
jgi:hypothetical protein